MPYADDPRLVQVQQEIKKLERRVDKIIWEDGPTDPRLVQICNELRALREASEKGEEYAPNF